jgi:hypothetical protein
MENRGQGPGYPPLLRVGGGWGARGFRGSGPLGDGVFDGADGDLWRPFDRLFDQRFGRRLWGRLPRRGIGGYGLLRPPPLPLPSLLDGTGASARARRQAAARRWNQAMGPANHSPSRASVKVETR